MCRCRGKRGLQGAAGAGLAVSSYEITVQNFSGSAITETIFASAAETGTLVFYGHVVMTGAATAGNYPDGRVTPRVDGSGITASVSSSTLRTTSTLMITGKIAITAGDAFDLILAQTAYTAAGSVDGGVINYYIYT